MFQRSFGLGYSAQNRPIQYSALVQAKSCTPIKCCPGAGGLWLAADRRTAVHSRLRDFIKCACRNGLARHQIAADQRGKRGVGAGLLLLGHPHASATPWGGPF